MNFDKPHVETLLLFCWLSLVVFSGNVSSAVEGDFHSPDLVNSIANDLNTAELLKVSFFETRPVIQIALDGRDPLPFFIDFGTARTAVFAHTASNLGISVRPYGGGSEVQDVVDMKLLDIEQVEIGSVSIFVHGLWLDDTVKKNALTTESFSVAGVIGWDLLRYLDLSLNLSSRKLMLYPANGECKSFADLASDDPWRIAPTWNTSVNDTLVRTLIDSCGNFHWMSSQHSWRLFLPAKASIIDFAEPVAGDEIVLGKTPVYVGKHPAIISDVVELGGRPQIAGASHTALTRLDIDLIFGIGVLNDYEIRLSPSLPHFQLKKVITEGFVSNIETKQGCLSLTRGTEFQMIGLYYSEKLVKELIRQKTVPKDNELTLVSSWVSKETLELIFDLGEYSTSSLVKAAMSAGEVGAIENLELIASKLTDTVDANKLSYVWIAAAKNGQIATFSWLEKHNVPFPAIPNNAPDLVHFSTESGSAEVVEYFLNKSSRVLGTNDLIVFAGNASIEDMDRLYSVADASLVSKAKPISLYVACKYANWVIAEHLIGDPSFTKWSSEKTGRTALMEAAHHGNLSVVQKLLESGADVLARDNEGRFALSEAVMGGGSAEVVAILAEAMDDAGADLTIWSHSVKVVSSVGDPADLLAIMEAGFSPDRLPNKNRLEALLNASRRGSLEMVKLLTVSKVDWVHINKQGKSALSNALAFRHQKLAMWISSQKGISLSKKRRVAAIIAALKVGALEVAEIYLERIRLSNEQDRLQFLYAAYNSGEVECLDILKNWFEENKFVIPMEQLEKLAAKKNYRGVTEWVDRLR